jgi:hypothetical protein
MLPPQAITDASPHGRVRRAVAACVLVPKRTAGRLPRPARPTRPPRRHRRRMPPAGWRYAARGPSRGRTGPGELAREWLAAGDRLGHGDALSHGPRSPGPQGYGHEQSRCRTVSHRRRMITNRQSRATAYTSSRPPPLSMCGVPWVGEPIVVVGCRGYSRSRSTRTLICSPAVVPTHRGMRAQERQPARLLYATLTSRRMMRVAGSRTTA